MPPAKVLCLTTGGSLDKTYDGVSSSFIVGAPTAKRCLRNVQCAHVVEYAEVCRKDSLELTKGDREVLDAAVRAAPKQYIVITHGTDTLNVTAKALQRTAVATGKTVVLTGAHETVRAYGRATARSIWARPLPWSRCCRPVVMWCSGRVFSDPDLIVKDVKNDRLVEKVAKSMPDAPEGICAYFAAGKRCKFGAKCRDRHCAADARPTDHRRRLLVHQCRRAAGGGVGGDGARRAGAGPGAGMTG